MSKLYVLQAFWARGCWAAIALAPIGMLRRHERFIDERVVRLYRDILDRGVLVKPLLVDSHTMIVLDGHHRLEALRRLGARVVPVLLVDYDDDRCVRVGSWREGWRVTKELVREVGLSGKLLPPRTSRHMLSFPVPEVNVPLRVLLHGGVWIDGCKDGWPRGCKVRG